MPKIRGAKDLNTNMNKNMTIGYRLTRPFSLAVLTVLVISLSLLVSRWKKPANATRVLTVLYAQQALATRCAPHDRLLLIPYAKFIAQIDVTACPEDFFNAWEKYVSAVQALSVVERVETGKAIVSIGAAVITENPAALLNALPKHPGQAEIARNTAVADWQNVKYIASRYGITIAPINQV